jgi:hypothetical protein
MKKLFTVIAVKWFDRINGNTYHSVKCIRNEDGSVIAQGMTYGYGDCYRQTALELMVDAGWIKGYSKGTIYGKYEIENNYPISWIASNGLKRDMVANGKL